MQYTKGTFITIERQTENETLKESIPIQDIFDASINCIRENTSDSNGVLQWWLTSVPMLAPMKNSNESGATLLMYAVACGNLEAANLLTEYATDINATEDRLQQTALHEAAFQGNIEMVDLLIRKGANVNVQNISQQTPLWIASSSGRLDIVRRISSVRGVELETANSGNWSPLHAATIHSHTQVVEHLVELNVDVNRLGNEQRTALHIAILSHQPEVAKLLINHGADVLMAIKKRAENGALEDSIPAKDILSACISWMRQNTSDSLNALRKFLTNAPEVTLIKTPNENMSLLTYAVACGNVEAAKIIIECGANINAIEGEFQQTALHLAIFWRRPEMAKLLIDLGAEVDIIDSRKQTPLSLATQFEYAELTDLLVKKGANPYIITRDNETVFDSALDSKNPNLLKSLWNRDHTRNLQQAVIEGDTETIERLLSENQFTEEELRVLFLSTMNQRNYRIASILLEYPGGLESKSGQIRTFQKDLEIDKANGVARENLSSYILEIYKNSLRSHLVFKGTVFEEKEEIFLDAFAKIRELLCDIPTCIKLLMPVEEELEKLFPQLREIEFSNKFAVKNLWWPGPVPENYQYLHKNGVLRRILRSYLQKHDIEAQDQLYTFAGFVENEKVNAVVRSGALFKEQFLMGNALTHGLYSHYIQWFLIARAIDTKRIILQAGLTLKEIMQASVDIQTDKRTPAWGEIIDNVTPDPRAAQEDVVRLAIENEAPGKKVPSRYAFSSVVELSSFLYTTPELPHLRGYHLDSLYKNIHKIQVAAKEKFPEGQRIEHKQVIAGQMVAFWNFNRFKSGLSHDDVDKYYKAKPNGELDRETGIVTKSANKYR